ncbi:MAG: twin-arginine translocase TatA/TatE family subunit [Candidatus Phosphoribacter sp.]|nr:twin-arginine translocase TatA/TatE family subunit [Actinomycetales bacterium]
MFDINGWEVMLLALVAVVVLGPERLPDYAAKLGRGVRHLRTLADGARGQLKEQLGPDFQDVDWRQYDPRQYDPRKIVREALLEPTTDPRADAEAARRQPGQEQPGQPQVTAFDPSRATPWDADAT